MGGRSYNYTKILNLPIHWNTGGNVEWDLHNKLAEAIEDILVHEVGATWKAPVANTAALPTIGNADGDARVTLDSATIWIWRDLISTWVPIGGSVYAGSFEQPAKPNTTQIPDGWWGYWWDTVRSELWHIRNRGGTMYGVELTAFP